MHSNALEDGVISVLRGPALTCVLIFSTAAAQVPLDLDEQCTATVGNQLALVDADGVFVVDNISVFQSRDTGIAPQLYRVRATCLRDGEAITGQSDFFSLTPGQTTFIADVFPSDLDPIPTSISVSAPGDNLGPGASLQLTVIARFADGTTENRTLRSAGTTFLSTNTSLLTVTEDGIVTGQNTGTSAGTGTIAVLNEGNLGTINVTAVPPSNDLDGDGMPNDYEDLFGLNKFFNDANLDLDSDGLTNLQEFNLGTIPNNPDTDNDGIIDGLDGDPLHPEESPPTVVIVSPTDGATLVEGQTILFSVDATDDGLITSVELSTDTGFSASFTTPPFEADFTVPIGVTQILFTATATDSVPNVTTTNVSTNVIPDPLTTVVGSVVDPDGLPVDGATLTTNGDLGGTTLPDGSFSIPDVPTILGDIVVQASATIADRDLTGRSEAIPPVLGGLTDVGIIQFGDAKVYVNNNAFTNSVSGFAVLDDGTLDALPGSPFPTGGSSSGITLLDSATICPVGNHLFVTNASSNDVTSFAILPDGSLAPVPGSPFPTGGSAPVPVVDHPNGELLFVGNFSSNTISIFSIDGQGLLSSDLPPAPTLPRGPIGLTINNAGTFLFVTFNSLGVIQVFAIEGDGSLSDVGQASAGSSSSVGMSINSTDTNLFVPDFGNTGVYVYEISASGDLSQIPGSPFPNAGASSPVDSEISKDDQFLYLANRVGTVTGFMVGDGGALSVLSGSPFPTGGSIPEVLALSSTRPFLYVVNSISRTLTAFEVGTDGTLTVLGSPVPTGASGFPTGIAISE